MFRDGGEPSAPPSRIIGIRRLRPPINGVRRKFSPCLQGCWRRLQCCYAWGLATANLRVRRGESIFDNSAVDLFWFRPARDRDRRV